MCRDAERKRERGGVFAENIGRFFGTGRYSPSAVSAIAIDLQIITGHSKYLISLNQEEEIDGRKSKDDERTLYSPMMGNYKPVSLVDVTQAHCHMYSVH
jgi:hypothetical protein